MLYKKKHFNHHCYDGICIWTYPHLYTLKNHCFLLALSLSLLLCLILFSMKFLHIYSVIYTCEHFVGRWDECYVIIEKGRKKRRNNADWYFIFSLHLYVVVAVCGCGCGCGSEGKVNSKWERDGWGKQVFWWIQKRSHTKN